MRYFCLILMLCLSQAVSAQFNSFKAGSYVLTDNPNVRIQGQLKLRDGELLVKDAKGETTKFTPRQVSSFRIGEKKYITARMFEASTSNVSEFVNQAFVALLDSGQVLLMHYTYKTAVASAPTMGPNGMIMGGGGASIKTVYLLCDAQNQKITPLSASIWTGSVLKFRAALLPFLTTRPDLAKLVQQDLVNAANLTELIHALNTGTPMPER